MIPEQRDALAAACLALFKARATEPVSAWCRRELRFNEPNNSGPFSLFGREYIVKPLDAFGQPRTKDIVLVFGSQSGKTALIMGGVGWLLLNDPARVLWVMPNDLLAQSFAETRWQPMLRASPALAGMIPTGAARHSFRKAQQTLGGSIVNFVGSNSPANLASNPARVVVLDEVEKLNTGGVDEGEADAVSLAEQRTKKFANAKRVKTSTPADADGLIWSEFQKGNQQRYFAPCPHCWKRVVLAWSPDFTIFRKTGREAWVKWDKEAKRADGSWDFDRVARSARAICPHCAGDIEEKHKTRLVRLGEWEPTAPPSPGFETFQLPSLYAVGAETTFGALAVKFLKAKRSPQGVRGFVTGDLAEPMAGQGDLVERVELFSAEAEPLADSVAILTVDVQMLSPYFWAVARSWRADGNSRLLWAGHFDEWENLRALQVALGVFDRHVIIDSGHKAQEVYENCLRWGERAAGGMRKFPLWRGWTPAKGRDRDTFWQDRITKLPRPYFIGSAALPSTVRVRLPLLEFNGEHLLGWLQRLRRGPAVAGLKWELIDFPTAVPAVGGAHPVDADEYFRHLNAKTLKPETRNGKTQHVWRKRSESWPDHLLDCEIQQLAGAMLHRRLPYATRNEKPADGSNGKPASPGDVASAIAAGRRALLASGRPRG